MKKITLVGLASLFILSGVALAGQSKEEKKGPSMGSMMEQMMKGEKTGESGMGEMMGMMGQMDKMMDQCSAMMGSGETQESQKK